MQKHGFWDPLERFLLILPVSLLVWGCASTQPAGRQAASGEEQEITPPGRELALRHFIDGSVYEMKGEYAKAILEYQDALRYEQNHAIYYTLSKDYAALNKYDLAMDMGRQALRLAPDNLEYRHNLADVYALAANLDSAAAQYEEIIRRDSDDIDARYSLARISQARNPEKALSVYQGILAQTGPDWDVLLQIADLCNKLGKLKESADALQQMALLDPDNIALKQNLAQAYLRAGEYDKALGAYEELRDQDPANLGYRAEMGGVYLQKKEYPRAAQILDPILANDTVALELKLHIGELYFGQVGRDSTLAPKALQVFERVRNAAPRDWRPYWFLGAIGTILHDDSVTVRNFRKVTELDDRNADAWVYLSSVFLEKNNFAEVATILESALRVLPDDFRVNFILGIAYSRLSRNTDAARLLEHAHALDPKNLDATAQLALVYDTMKRYEESDSLYEEALRIDPNNHLVLNNYGYSLADRGVKLQRALAMSKKALESQPDNSSYLDTMGWIYFRLGEYQQAETYVKQSIQKGEGNAVVFEHLGDIYYKLNDKQRALEQWENALKLDQDNAALKDKIARGSL